MAERILNDLKDEHNKIDFNDENEEYQLRKKLD